MPPLSSPSSKSNNALNSDSSEYSESEDSEPFIRGGRKSRHVSVSNDSAAEFEDTLFDDIAELKARPQEKRHLESIRSAEFVYPPSLYHGYIPPITPSKEEDVIKDFIAEIKDLDLQASNLSSDRGFLEYDLNDYTIYLPDSVAHHPGTMTGLQNLGKTGYSTFLFDGILSLGSHRRYVQGVPFKLCSIGNYGHELDSVEDQLWIQSNRNQGSDIYYRLQASSDEYSRYHEGFVWLANLAKYFVDYLEYISGQHRTVSIHNFKADFVRWLDRCHETSESYRHWYEKYGSRDFRSHVSANAEFLFKETSGISEELLNHPVWKEVYSMDFIPMQKMRAKKTVVTPYVFECFKHLKFGAQLSSVAPNSGVQFRRKSLGVTLQLTTDASLRTSLPEIKAQSSSDKKSISVGDVLAVPMDDKNTSLWKDEGSKWKPADACWYVLVQGIHISKDKKRSFDVIWLYKPSDTTCAKMKYPYSNELFLSDNCSCETQRITEEEVLCKVSVDWNGLPGDARSDFIIRQTYLRSNAFITLKERHKRCEHLRDEVKPALQELVEEFKVGDTVLYVPPANLKPKHGLEPGEIVEFLLHGSKGFVTVRRLLRRRDLDIGSEIRPNELVYSDELCTVSAYKIKRRCFVRFYTESEVHRREVPAPYNRDGTGDAFYITTRQTRGELQPIQPTLTPSFLQGADFRSTPLRQRLRGLDLYCGGGNFGRGLEEGGAVRNTHAVDLDVNAIHTYWANLEKSSATKLFYGSVNDMLTAVLEGNPSKSNLIPLPGDIDFISAGSPCPGFSVLNSNRDNERGLQNQSLVASVAAYIDMFRPKYALLENVITMAQKGKGRDEDVLSQLICCIVGLGYQVQVFNLDAWSFGSPQSRSRLFVSIAAPGLEPPPHPGLSHSHPHGTKDRGLGQMASGHSFGERLFKPTPFEYVTAQEATDDLPDIGDGRTNQCIRHPDHRMARGIPRHLKAQIEIIPINPRGMNFVKTWKQGLITRAERALFPTVTKAGKACHSVALSSKAWERIHPQLLFPTIATSASPACARTGRCLHWDQQRLITVLEARRAQSFPDEEVLTGLPSKQWRIIGNSVARTVSLALGLSLWEACRKNSIEEQNLNPVKIVLKEPEANDVDSTINSYVSALEDFDRVSSDSAVRSERSYNNVLHDSGLKSSTNDDESSSTRGSTNSSEGHVSQVRRRTYNIPTPATSSQAKQKQRPDLASKGNSLMILESGRSMTVGDDISENFVDVLSKSQVARGIIRTKRPTWQQGQPRSTRSFRAEKQDVLKRKRVSQDKDDETSSESEGRNSSQFKARSRMDSRTSHHTKRSGPTVSMAFESTTKSTLAATGGKNGSSSRILPKTKITTKNRPIKPSTPPFTSTPMVVIDLISDSDENENESAPALESEDEDKADDDDDNNPKSASPSTRKVVKTYAPVNNDIFIAYQRTYETMRTGARRR